MTMSPRTSALSVMAVYWLLLIVGMASCIAMRTDASIAAIWTGTVAGTALGHALVLLNTRSWFALLTVLTTAALVGPSAPGELSASTLWLAFIPAAVCAYWSLGDRTALVAFWFPAVIWMLSILDRAKANGIPDDTGVALLGLLALLFLLFLRVREARRVALWTTVPMPATTLAVQQPAVMLKVRPGVHVARSAWALVASALAFAATAWVAPQLWKSESLPGEHSIIDADPVAIGLPCCPTHREVVVPKARVKEYFNVGRGHDEQPIADEPESCVRCEGGAVATGPGTSYPYGYYTTVDPGPYVATGEPIAPPTANDDSGGSVTTHGYSGGSTTYDPGAHDWNPPVIHRDPPAASAHEPGEPAPLVEPAPFVAQAPIVVPQVVEPAPVEPAPQVIEPQQPPPQAPPQVAPHEATAAPPHEPPHIAATNDASSATPSRRPSSMTIGPSLMQWIGVILAAAVLMQLAALALRPLRRYVTLRHLRRPYWEETVDQRVSNAWQLALVGLRDAGWRSDGSESPRELANRVGIDGVERCASILERARHGIGIDAEDLATMSESAERAYRDARSRLGSVARATTWLRWPLT
jgi:hypothetical protein